MTEVNDLANYEKRVETVFVIKICVLNFTCSTEYEELRFFGIEFQCMYFETS